MRLEESDNIANSGPNIDPFFEEVWGISAGKWNACIGNQGHEEHYVDGYIDAAIELVDAIFEKKLWGKRDTLVLPILYNARHSIELTLKFATTHLTGACVITNNGRKPNHDIEAYWDHLHNSAIGDESLSQAIAALKPYVDSLSNIDSDGQELRYHQSREGDQSLSEHAVVNLQLIRSSLYKLKELILRLTSRTADFIDERKTNSYTTRCSRTDLLTIANLMPPRDKWHLKLFNQSREMVKDRYKLSNRQFSQALEHIQENREMRSMLGMESDLLHLTDDDIIWVIKQWQRLHPAQSEGEICLDLKNADQLLKIMTEENIILGEVTKAIEARLSPEALAELEAMFYLERDRIFVEYYEGEVKSILEEHMEANDPQSEIRHLMEKTNFLHCIHRAAIKLGRLSLGQYLNDMQVIKP